MNSPSCRPLSRRFISSSDLVTTARINDSGNSRPMTASVCSRSLASEGRRSMRDARIACTVGGIFNSREWLRELHRAVAHQRSLIEQHLHRLFHEERVALGLLDDYALEWCQLRRRRRAARTASPRRSLCRAGRVATAYSRSCYSTDVVFGTVIDQQQNLRGADRIGQQVEQLLRRVIDPVQVLEDHHQRLIERFAQQNPFDRLERAPRRTCASICASGSSPSTIAEQS